jgi:hypothetical protein
LASWAPPAAACLTLAIYLVLNWTAVSEPVRRLMEVMR